MGSEAVLGWIAQVAFWLLLAVGFTNGALSRRRAAVLVALWIAGQIGLPRLGPAVLVMSYVAVLDIALVFIVVYGDTPLK